MLGLLRFIINFIFIILLFLILYSFAMFQGGFVSWFLFFSFLPIFLYHLGILFYPINNWKITRSMSHHVIRAGDHVSVTIKIKRNMPFPLYYCIIEEVVPDTLKRVDMHYEKFNYMDEPNKLNVNRQLKKIVFPWFRRIIEIPYEMKFIPRGEHELQTIRIRTGDVFGFIKKEHVYQVTDQLIAYPNQRSIKINEHMSNFEQGSTSSYLLNLKNTNIASGIREYVPGDKFSWIDWKQSARNNIMMTKEFEQEKSTDTLFVLDGCYYEDGNPIAFEGAVEATASLMETVEKQSSQVGLLSIGEDVVHFPVHQDPTTREWIRQHLTRIQPIGMRSFAEQLSEEMAKVGNRFVIMIVTTDLNDPLQLTIQRVRQRTKQVIIFLVQSEKRITSVEHGIIQQLKHDGIIICMLTETDLIKNDIEVNI